ncbi:MAG: NAD(P)/FAD-dependent oxidoreductase [Novosphingobium sp.]|nr:NAD(P)/FAD-dependent oxidoreductase [Novosphingobium sp.]MCP5401239.1 NAD(P)/FAD-dependent oxidoreductase [Novosphingobium sp.]
MDALRPTSKPVDLLIVGAGISGIGMAAHFTRECPRKSYAIVERRERLGGTWDLFRYPGIRSDSDMYTLGYQFEPWRNDRSIAGGDAILAYLDQVADKYAIRERISFDTRVVSADWDSAQALWTIETVDAGGIAGRLSGRFLFFGSGYYDYDEPHDAGIPGLANFGGTAVHPQFWPQDLDHSGKRIVVIGSGATAATLVPALAEKAAHVTMLQRTPSWYFARPAKDRLAMVLRRILPEKAAYALTRMRNIRLQDFLFRRAREKPDQVKAFLHKQIAKQLPGGYEQADFSPPYNPWEQRLCLVPDGDLFKAIGTGKASIATGLIDTVDETGIRLEDGSHLDADIIVTATGLKLSTLGKIAVTLDGKSVDFTQAFYYRNCMFSNVPNLAALFGYLNAAWTLRVDIVASWLCRLLNHMDARGFDVATPLLPEGHGLVEANPVDLFSSGYLRRGRDLIPKSATTAPWRLSMDYLSDRKEMRSAPIEDGVLQFGRATEIARAR